MSSRTRTRRDQILALTVALFTLIISFMGWRAQARLSSVGIIPMRNAAAMKTAAVHPVSSTVTAAPEMTRLAAGWTETKVIGIRSTDSNPLTNFQVLVELTPGNFNYAAANVDGSDLRFGSTNNPTFDLSYYLESWNPGGTSRLWVKLPTVAPNSCTNIYLFYGNPMATTTTSNFAATFPNAFVSTGAMGGDTLTGNQTFDWFEVKAGHTLNIGAGQILSVTARNVIIAGTVNGAGAGYQAPGNNTNGTGPGGGSTGGNTAGSGGGSYAGVGGTGGYDNVDTPATGGPTYGTQTGTDIDMGSSGGSSDLVLGGNGGGALSLLAQEINISGTVNVPGELTSSNTCARCGGGGSGGGILIRGYNVVVAGTFNANGGNGGIGTSVTNDSGGGGAGGRIKFFGENTLSNTATTNVNGGAGGPNGGAAPGQPGGAGTTHAASGAAAFDYPQVTASASDSCCSPAMAMVSGTTAICAGGMASVAVEVSGGVAPYTVTLNNGGGTLMGSGPFIFNVSPSSTTTYSVQSAMDANGCPVMTSGSALVTVNALPETPTISGNLSFCSNGSTTLTATGSGTFMWFKNNTLIPGQSTNMLTVLEAGSYTVKVTDANSCASATSQPAVVTIKPTPVVNPATPAAICSGTQTNIVLGSTPSGATFSWTASLQSGSVSGFSNSSGSTIAQTLTGNGVVKYTVTATLNGCPSAPVDILQTVNALTSTAALTARTVCEGAPVSFSTTASGTGPFSFVWKKGATVLTNGGNLTITTNGATSTLALAAAAVADAGSYSVEVTGACNTVTQTAVLTVNTLPTISDPTSVNLLQGGTASFSVTPTGTPTPSVQWQISTDGGNTFTDIPSATSTTLSLPNVTPAMNGYRYRAIAANSCGTATSRAATLSVSPYGANFTDPLVCLQGGDLVTLTAAITNNGAAAITATFSVTNLAPNLIGIPGSGLASVAPANFVITATSATWNGTLQAGETVTFAFKAQIAPNVASGTQLCVTSTATLNGGTPVTLTPCTRLACPTAGVAPSLSAQKPGSLLVFPYYTSRLATKADTRFTLSNIGATTAFVHLFFVDGASCQPTDQFLCLTPGASYAGKASETDGETTGWILAVAVNPQGHPIQANQLIGNAFVNDGEYVDTYGAEAFTAHSSLLAAVQGDTALLFLDGQGYDAVANQLAVEIQSPVNAPQQKVVTVGLRGDLNASTVSGAGQIGTGLLINGNEKPLGSFTSWLNGSCQAIATITAGSPRVPTGVSGMIPSGEHGTLQWRIGGGVGLLLTPRSAQWKGIRPLHKTGLTTASLRIPLFPPHC